MGDMVKSFFGEDKMPDAGRAAQLLRGYLDDKLKAPERVPRQEKEEFLRVVQHIPPQENPQLERLIDKVTKLFERQTDDVPAPSMYTDEGPGAITPDLPVILPRNNPPPTIDGPMGPEQDLQEQKEEEDSLTLDSWTFNGSGEELRDILEQYVGRVTDKTSKVFNASSGHWIQFNTVRKYMISGQRPENAREGVQRWSLRLSDGSAVLQKV